MSEKLAVLFPGVGYHVDRPLLYHSAKLARERGYEFCAVSYPPLPTGLRGKPERIQQAIELCSRAASEQLSGIALEQNRQLLFISKSLGTAVAAVCAARFSLSPLFSERHHDAMPFIYFCVKKAKKDSEPKS